MEPVGAASEDHPNVLIILVDDLGFSDLGAFGGEIDTPNLDALAAEGVRLTDFYTAPTCSPTRAMLLSGTDPHVAGLGTMAEVVSLKPSLGKVPGYEGYLSHRALSLAEVFRAGGYNTYMSGKWHLGVEQQQGPHLRGFIRSFALLEGGASHFQPRSDSKLRVENVSYREDGAAVGVPDDFYSSSFYTQKLIEYIDSGIETGKPFFAYAAYTAPHWPLHAPDELIDKYSDRYRAGYAAIRAERLLAQERLGLFPDSTVALSVLNEAAPLWEALSDEERDLETKKMAVYAAMVDSLDTSIGRLLQYLRDIGEYDDTIILFFSDNGAAGEDHARGYSPNTAREDNSLENIGRRGSNVNYGFRWAEVSAAPFKLVKGTTAEGGISSPAIMRLPETLLAPGSLLRQVTRVDDLAPTLLELANVKISPTVVTTSLPFTGSSLASQLLGTSPVNRDRILAGELFGQAYVRAGDWKLVSSALPASGPPFPSTAYRWQLYDLSVDRGETRDLAADYPDRVANLLLLWETYVTRYGVVTPDAFKHLE
tara:strand:- start:61000 stop:62613 length:1614 start_codon:yes stop_codon:yes gene_type:complete